MKFNLIPCISSMIVLAEYEISLDRYSSIRYARVDYIVIRIRQIYLLVF